MRHLAFHNLHTDEKLSVTYWKDGAYDRGAWGRSITFCAIIIPAMCSRWIIRLIDLLHDLQGKLHKTGDTIEIISGYRSPQTNLRLASLSDGVAKNSYHTKGMAIDIRMPGTSLPHITQCRARHAPRRRRLLSLFRVRAYRCGAGKKVVINSPEVDQSVDRTGSSA